MKEPTIKVVSFDAYGTLVRLERPFELIGVALRKRGFRIPQEAIRTAFSDEMAYYREHHMEGRDTASLADLRYRCAELLFNKLEALGYPCRLERFERYAVLMESIRFGLFPDVIPSLRWCSETGLKTAVVSNWDFSLNETLSGLLTTHSFNAVMVSAVEGMDKSGPEIFLRAARALGEPPSAVLHVGDNLLHDFESPLKAGYDALLIQRDKAEHAFCKKQIKSLKDISTHISTLRSEEK